MVSMELVHGAVQAVPAVQAYRPTIQLLVAYIDPGSGALMLQMLLAMVVGVLVSFRKALGALISRVRSRNDSDPTRDH